MNYIVKDFNGKTCPLMDMSVLADQNIALKKIESFPNMKMWKWKLAENSNWKQK